MTDGTQNNANCCSDGKKSCCPVFRGLYALLHIAILTCISMALWKTAWAIEALAPASGG